MKSENKKRASFFWAISSLSGRGNATRDIMFGIVAHSKHAKTGNSDKAENEEYRKRNLHSSFIISNKNKKAKLKTVAAGQGIEPQFDGSELDVLLHPAKFSFRAKLRDKESNLDFLVQSQTSYH